MPKLIRITTVPVSLEKLLGKQLTFMSHHFLVTAISANKRKLKEVADKFDVNHHHVEMTRQITPIQDVLAVWKLYRYLIKERPHIVHTHTPKAGLVGMVAARFAGVPVRMHTVAGMPLMETTGIKRKILNAVEKITYAFATKVYPNSKGLRRFIEQENLTSTDKLKVLGQGSSNGIDTTLFVQTHFTAEQNQELRDTLGISKDAFVFIFVV